MEIPQSPRKTRAKRAKGTAVPFANRLILPPREAIGVVAVSGGADSVCLLRALHALQYPVVVAHLNHQLRGPESDADADFVEQLALQLGLPIEIESRDVSTDAAGENLENHARKLRYPFFEKVAQKRGAQWIATGHTADDQAETIVQRLLRGTGIRGLAGIHEEIILPSGCQIFRPLLRVERIEIVQYLQTIPQSWREDSSNADMGFSRNRVRREILPLLKQESQAVVSLLGRLAEQAVEMQALLETAAQEALKACRIVENDTPFTVVLKLEMLPKANLVRTELFRAVWRLKRWPLDDMTHDHWKRLSALVDNKEQRMELPGKIEVTKTRQTMILKK